MSLARYTAKRDFAATPEPKGKPGRRRQSALSFVIHKHDATRLHYDLRLELDGVLKSWAVTRGPSLDPDEKRLAVRVEDHPLDYGSFEGTIPKGQYGGGTVIVWDRGTWVPAGEVAAGLAKGHLDFTLDGEKLHGRWHLVRITGKPGEKRENWLLIKAEDEYARPQSDGDILETAPLSVRSGRSIPEVAADAPPRQVTPPARDGPKRAPRKAATAPADPTPADPTPDPAAIVGARPGALPEFLPPMLASAAPRAPAGGRWLHEIKFDGYRVQVRIRAGKLRLLTRSGLDWTQRFGKPLAAALRALPPATALMDGEIVVEGAGGVADFSALQADLSAGRDDRFVLWLFDLMHLEGTDLTGAALADRKRLLQAILPAGDGGPVRYAGHFDADGAEVLHHACRLGLEGVVSKLHDAPYRSGRSKSWVKAKCSARQEFVIGGFVPSTSARRAIGSLVLGQYDAAGRLTPVGRVGTGFSAKVAADLFVRLEALRSDTSAFAPPLAGAAARGVRPVRPDLVAEVDFRDRTADGQLRHASFRGLREDKPARDVVAEPLPARARRGAAPAKANAMPAGSTVRLTHPDRLYWPDDGLTKQGLADYYADIWPQIAPHVVGRPLSLVRAPEGIGGPSFYQKHLWAGADPAIRAIPDPKDAKGEAFIVIEDLDGLVALAQSAALEIHPWGATAADPLHPDRLVMDLDPGPGVPWDAVIAAAQDIRVRMEAAGLAAFVKTSGGKGLHVVTPLVPDADWDAAKGFARDMAVAMAADAPDRFVATVAKAQRKGKILVDYLRNGYGATAVAAWSPRARPGAPVSTPLTWDELPGVPAPDVFTVMTVARRLAALRRDAWDGFEGAARPLPRGAGNRAPKR